MVTLLLGPSGYGKSTYIVNKIKEDYEAIIKDVESSGASLEHDIRSYLIVPEQQTLISERQLASTLPATAQLYVEATNLTRLADSVFRKTGGLKYNYITEGAQNLLMYRAICEVRDTLKYYNDISRGKEKGYIKLFLQAIGELKAYSVSIEQLEHALEALDVKNTPETEVLRAKTKDLLLVWSSYEHLREKNFDDPHSTLSMLAEKIAPSGLFNGRKVYIDSFYGFTKSQLDVIAKIIELASDVTIALDCPVDATTSTIQYVKIASTRDKILGICQKLKKKYEIKSFTKNEKHKSEELQFVCENVWNFDANPILPMGTVKLATAASEFEECEYVCAKIKQIILNKTEENEDEQYGKIAIIARNSSTYRGIIEFCLDKYEIPYYFSAPSKLTAQPVIRMINSALNALNGMRSEDIITYIKCGFTGIEKESRSALEAYIYRWSIYGKKFENDDYWSANPNGYKEMSKADEAELVKVHEARKKVLSMLAILKKPFESGLSVKECAEALYDFLEKHSVRQALLREIKNDIKAQCTESAQTTVQVWEAIISALNTLVDICGDARADVPTFTALLGYAMMDTKIGTIPTGEDKVIIADASLVRAKNIRHVFILGANEGVFPAVVDDDSFFSDRDKVELETVKINLTPTIVNGEIIESGFLSAKTFERNSDELFFFANSLASASHTATVTALKSDISGGIRRPSIGFLRISELLNKLEPADISEMDILDSIYTQKMATELYGVADKSLKEAIISSIDEDLKATINSPADEKPIEANDSSVDEAPTDATDSSVAKKMTSSSFVTSNEAVSKKTAKKVFGEQMKISKSRLECFIKCHFDYYCSHVLKLNDCEKIKLSHNHIGTYIHKIFEVFLKNNDTKKTYTRKEILEIVDKHTSIYVSSICGTPTISNKIKHLFDRLKTTVAIFVEALLEEMRTSNFTPEFFEIDINGNGVDSPSPTVLNIGNGVSAVLTGIADRIDVYRQGEHAYIRVIDYKTGSYSFDAERLAKGLDMQMLIYLLALCDMDECEFKKKLLGDQGPTKISAQGMVYLTYHIDKTKTDFETELFSANADDSESATILGKVTRSGLELDNDEFKSSDDAFNLKEGSLSELGNFTDIFELVKSNIEKICLDMLNGDARAEPLDGETPCDYCKNGAICRRRVKSAYARN